MAASLSFGFLASLRSGEVGAHVSALTAWLRQNASVDLKSRPMSTYETLITGLRDGSTDVAWLPPVAYAWLAEAVTPIGSIVRQGKTSFSSALIVREDSKITALTDLSGVRAGWVDPWSAAGYVVPRLELSRSGVSLSRAFRREKFFGTHRDVCLALGRDECDVAGTYARAPAEGAPATEGAWSEVKDLKVRVLKTFGMIPPDVIAVRRNLALKDYELVLAAFKKACSDERGRPLVRSVFDGDELREGVEPGHDALRTAYESGVAKGLFDREG